MRTPSATKVAALHEADVLRQAALSVRSQGRIASRAAATVRDELSVEVLSAFGEAMLPLPSGTRVAAVSRKLKQLWDMFQRAPDMWQRFKDMLGIRASGTVGLLRELPGKIKSWLKDGRRYLEKVGKKFREIPVVALYLDVARKMPGVTDLLTKLLDQLPESVQNTVRSITTKMRSLAELLDYAVNKYRFIKPASIILSAAVFAVIWFNVTEMTWDIPEILRGFLGMYSWVELLHSLPESAVGFLISLMFPGIPGGLLWNVLLPITVALRVAWLVQQGHLEYKPGRELRSRNGLQAKL